MISKYSIDPNLLSCEYVASLSRIVAVPRLRPLRSPSDSMVDVTRILKYERRSKNRPHRAAVAT
jgi:hypothetical protein